MYTIGDLVKLDEHITEQSVVQIDFYTEQERNLALLRNFVFARSAPEGLVSNLEVLYRLREASLTDARENIFCVIANYGQGKSHLGLVLANYFGREVDSEEFRMVMDKIAHAEGDGARVANLREFREQRQPYLVLRLRGDSPLPLDQQFLQALQRALHEAGEDGNLPLWYQKAAEWLESLPQRAMEQQANEFLRQRGTDLPALIARVRAFEQEAYGIVNQLHRDLIGTHPSFEGSVEIGETLGWLIEHYCDTTTRFGGVLILFDEFSLFVERYYRQRTHAGSLQRLLEKVDRLRTRTLFLAFAQHDPTTMASRALGDVSQEQIEEALRELQRLPERNKLLLHTRMERVIDGYLRQEDSPFPDLLRQNTLLEDQIWDAAMLAKQSFSSRYSEQQEWTDEQFHEIVGKGCFPLHPLTTAILCQGIPVSTSQVEAPRTVLGFVLDRVRSKLADIAVTPEAKPNWIYPVELIDYFYNMLPDQEVFQYRTALQRIEGEPTPEQLAVLKAILLITLTPLTTRRDNFVQVVSHLSGLEEHTVKQTLHHLAEVFALYEEGGRYRFYSLGGDLRRLQQLKQEVMGQTISDKDVDLVNERFQVSPEVHVTWGHRDDWQARQVIWLVRDFTERNLKREAPLFRVGNTGLNLNAKRGLVIRLLALSEEEMSDLAERVSETLDRAFPEENAPAILVVLPTRPMPDLLRWVRWDNYLWLGMSPADKQQIGEELINRERTSVRRQIEEDKSRLLDDRVSSFSTSEPRLIVPRAYRVAFQNDNPQTVQDALRCLYAQAYRYAPPFFTQYHHGSIHLRANVRQLCIALPNDKVKDIVHTFGNHPGTDCVRVYLQGQWRILKSDYTIQPPPPGSKVKPAWDLLDQAFSSTEVATPVREALLRLMNPPYGYHFHQLALLFSAWYGYHRKQIELSIDGKLDSLLSIWGFPQVDRSERFIEQLTFIRDVTIKQRDVDKELEQVQQLVRRILPRTEYLSLREAEGALSVLKAALESDTVEQSLRADVQRAIEMLEKDMGIAHKYDDRAEQLLKMAQRETELRSLVGAYSKPQLPDIGIVEPSQPSLQEIRSRLMAQISQVVENLCKQAEQIDRLEDVNRYRDRLREALVEVRRAGNQDWQTRVQQAQENLERRVRELQAENQERELIGGLETMSPRAPLATLREYAQRLQQISPQSPKAQEIHQRRQREIEEAIQQSEQRLRDWQHAFKEAGDEDAIDRLQREVSRYWTHYESSPEAKHLEDLEEKCRQILALTKQAFQLARSTPANPDAVHELKQQLARIRSESEHPAVQNAVAQAERQLEEYQQRKVEEAMRWLQQKELEVQTKRENELTALLQQLHQPPAFLPESERGRWETLKQVAQQRVDEDAVQSVRLRLRQIRDRQKLLQLREEIDQLLKELGVGHGSP